MHAIKFVSLLVFAVLLLTGVRVPGQEPIHEAAHCLKEVKHIYLKLNDIALEPETGQAYYLSYSARAVMRDSLRTAPTESRVEALMAHNLLQYKTNDIEFFQDDKRSITVLPRTKTVYLANAMPDAGREKRSAMLALFQDSVLNNCTVQQCSDIRLENGTAARKVLLACNSRLQSSLGLRSIELTLDLEAQSVQRLLIRYGSASRVAYVELRFHSIDYNYDLSNAAVQPGAQVLDSKQRLRGAYAGYTLVDTRTQSSRN